MLPLCREEGIGVMPWSPLACGRLTRDWNETNNRMEADDFGKDLYIQAADSDRMVVERVAQIAAQRGVPHAQVALAWLLRKPGVATPIIGTSKPHHLDDAIKALSLTLTADEIQALEGPYVPHRIAGFS